MRVIAGSLRGRILTTPRGFDTRPTLDRVKEALFSILGSIDNLKVLDLYAGTGAFGIEALSRGAKQAVFVEKSRPALQCLRDNLSRLGLEGRSKVFAQFVERAQRNISISAPFDLVFCDPPWTGIEAAWNFLANMQLASLLSPGGRLVLEHPAEAAVSPGRFSPLATTNVRAWGDSAVTILDRSGAAHNA